MGKRTALKNLKILYQITPKGLGKGVESDIQASLQGHMSRLGISHIDTSKLSRLIARDVANHLEKEIMRLEWQATGVTMKGREGGAFGQTLEDCSTPEALQKSVQRWVDRHHNLSPPEERVLRSHFQRITSHTFCQLRMLRQIEDKKPSQRTATLARLIVQMEENPQMTIQLLRSDCKSYPDLLALMGFPTHAQGQQLQEALDPLMEAVYKDIQTQLHQLLTTQMTQLFKKHPPAKGKETEKAEQLINLKKQQKIHQEELMRNAKTQFERSSSEKKAGKLEQIQHRVNSRAARLKTLVHTAASQAIKDRRH